MNKSNSGAVFILVVMVCFGSLSVLADTAESRYQVNDIQRNVYKSGDFGLGLMFGSTSGITAKIWANEINALDLGIAFQDSNTAVMADYLWHWRGAFTPSANDRVASAFVPYAGVGAIAAFGGNNFFYHNLQAFGFGARVPVGMEFLPRGLPFGLFIELDPGVGFVPDMFTFVEGNIGGRYYF